MKKYTDSIENRTRLALFDARKKLSAFERESKALNSYMMRTAWQKPAQKQSDLKREFSRPIGAEPYPSFLEEPAPGERRTSQPKLFSAGENVRSSTRQSTVFSKREQNIRLSIREVNTSIVNNDIRSRHVGYNAIRNILLAGILAFIFAFVLLPYFVSYSPP